MGADPRIRGMNDTLRHREWLAEESAKRHSRRMTAVEYWKDRFHISMWDLKDADPTGWETWWDDDKNIPQEATKRQFCKLVEARVKELGGPDHPNSNIFKGVMVWRDGAGHTFISVADETNGLLQVTNPTQARQMITNRLLSGTGYAHHGRLKNISPKITKIEREKPNQEPGCKQEGRVS
jgi:hypothetical protein